MHARLALVLLLAPGCLTPPPPGRWEAPELLVRADSDARAGELGRAALGDLTWVRATLPGLRDVRPEVWEVERISPFRGFPLRESTTGLTFRFLWVERIYLDDGAERGSATHEFGHFLLGPVWDPLPPFLEEGLCEWLAVNAPTRSREEQRGARQRRVVRLAGAALGLAPGLVLECAGTDGGRIATTIEYTLGAADLEEAARFGPRRMLNGHDVDRALGFGYGLALVEAGVERFGIEGWFELCAAAGRRAEARLDLPAVLAALGMDGVDDFRARFLATLEREVLVLALDQVVGDLASTGPLAQVLEDLEPSLRGLPLRELVQRSSIRAGLVGCPLRVPLRELERVVASAP